MGHTSYSTVNATTMRHTKGVYAANLATNFKQRAVHEEMRAVDAQMRECRDSDEHPQSQAVIIGLDVTGSMGSVPQLLVRDGLPNIMGKIIENGGVDPAVLFLGIGDHECDRAPLQVGQFESGDEELDHWLESTWLEGGGGGNYGESYLLAWYFAAHHTSIDCWEKRKQRGILITIGDEPPLRDISAGTLKGIMSHGQFSDMTATGLLAEAQRTYDCHHIHLNHHGDLHGDRYGIGDWEQLMGENLHVAQGVDKIVDIVVQIVTGAAKAEQDHGIPEPEEKPETPATDDEVVL